MRATAMLLFCSSPRLFVLSPRQSRSRDSEWFGWSLECAGLGHRRGRDHCRAKSKKDTSCTHDRDKYGHDQGYQTATHVPVSSVERVPAVEVETVDVVVRGELVPGVEVVGSVSGAVAKF
jgi:hypothetical protein